MVFLYDAQNPTEVRDVGTKADIVASTPGEELAGTEADQRHTRYTHQLV